MTFVGSIPASLRSIVKEAASQWPVGDAYIGCSGNFTLERTLRDINPEWRLHGNDVSIFTTAIGKWLAGEPVELSIVDDWAEELDWISPHLDGGVGSVAVLQLLTHFAPDLRIDHPWRLRNVQAHQRDFARLHEETVRKLDALHLYDCLRANKAMAAWGVEARVPFLDRGFIDAAMQLDPEVKLSGAERGRIEKQFLREAFAGYLPDEVLWRQKEQFSDGVGYAWIDSLKAHAAAKVGAQELANAHFRFPYNTPLTAEAYLYRTLFEQHFPQDWAARCVPGGPSVACSTAAALESTKARSSSSPSSTCSHRAS